MCSIDASREEILEKLTEDNWRPWSMRVKAVPEGKGLWKVIGGDDNDEAHIFSTRATLVKAVSNDFLSYVSDTHPKAAWALLSKNFNATAATRVSILELQLQSCKKRPEETTFNYCHRVRQLVTEIQLIDPEGARQAVMCLLRGLPETHQATRIFLLNQNPRPSLSDCQAALVNAEQNAIDILDSADVVALYAGSHGGGRGGGRGFQGRGRWGGRSQGKGRNQGAGDTGFFKGRCDDCGENGHKWRECPYADGRGNRDARGGRDQGRLPYVPGF